MATWRSLLWANVLFAGWSAMLMGSPRVAVPARVCFFAALILMVWCCFMIARSPRRSR